MDRDILYKYGISFHKKENGFLEVNAPHPYLDFAILLNRFAQNKSTLQELIYTINLALSGKHNEVLKSEKEEWHEELGTEIYTGIIKSDMTFDIFIEDHYEKTLISLPLIDTKEIIVLLLNYMQKHF